MAGDGAAAFDEARRIEEEEGRAFRPGEFGPPGTGWQVLIARKAV